MEAANLCTSSVEMIKLGKKLFGGKNMENVMKNQRFVQNFR